MNKEELRKRDLLVEIGEEVAYHHVPHLLQKNTVRAFTRHFWPSWYRKRKMAGKDASLEGFLEHVQESCLYTCSDRSEENRTEHQELLDELRSLGIYGRRSKTVSSAENDSDEDPDDDLDEDSTQNDQ